MAKQRKKDRAKSVMELPVIRPDAAGVDIGATEICVAVGADREAKPVRKFGAFTRDLVAIADWLTAVKIRTVAMESTGVYWIPLFQHLEAKGFEVLLVNAHHIKNVPGRKTDVSDAQWIQFLHAVGLLRGSFRPSQEICAIRSLVRHRESLVQMASQCILMMQKAMTQMNLQLHNVISSITGCTGMRILEAILAGERDPVVLAKLCREEIKAPREVVERSLEGDYRGELLFILKQNLRHYQDLQKMIGDVEQQAGQLMDELPGQVDLEAKPLPPASKRHKRKPNTPAPLPDLREKQYRILGTDLTMIPGINTGTIEVLLSEVGPDLSAFASASRFSSWLALCPNNKESGGKRISGHTRKQKSRVATALRIAAQSLVFSDTALGDFHRRMRAKFGPAKAVTASAHKLARIVYRLITTGEQYDESVFGRAQEKHRRHQEAKLKATAKKFGYQLIPIQEAA